MNNSFKLTSDQSNKIKNFLQSKISSKDAVSMKPKTQYEVLRVEKCGVLYILYTSNKLLIQGSSNGKYYDDICNILGISTNKNATKKLVHHEFKEYIGVDEVGVSDYFGGLVSAAFLLDDNSAKLIKELKIKDSKKMEDNYILKIGKTLLEKCRCEYFYLDNINYNLLNSKYKNINTLKTYVHNKAIAKLVSKYKLEIRASDSKDDISKLPIVLDKYTENSNYYSQLKTLVNKKDLDYKHTYYIRALTTKAESYYLGVAAASVVARYVFLNEIEKLNKKYNLNFPLGSSNAEILKVGKMFISKWNKDKLKEVAKIDTKTTLYII